MAERSARPHSRGDRLDVPAGTRTGIKRPHYDPEAFGRFSEQIARFLGTGRFLVYLTLFCAVWLAWNSVAPHGVQFDSHTNNFTLLTLILSLQASYAAPLILLAQNRQVDRDRVTADEDRDENKRLQADVEYLTVELASLRQALGEVATRDFLREQIRELADEVVLRTSEGTESALEARLRRDEQQRRRAKQKRKAQERTQAKDAARERGSLAEPFPGEVEDE